MQGIQESLHLTLHPLLVKQNPEWMLAALLSPVP